MAAEPWKLPNILLNNASQPSEFLLLNFLNAMANVPPLSILRYLSFKDSLPPHGFLSIIF